MKKHLNLLFYIAGALVLVYALCAGWDCHKYVSALISQKQLIIKGNEFAIVSYYMTNAGNYLLSALVLLGIGLLISEKTAAPCMSTRNDVTSELPILPEEAETENEPLEGFAPVSEGVESSLHSLPTPVQEWLVLNKNVLVQPYPVQFSLATICLNLFEEMDIPLHHAGYELNVEPKEAFSVDVFVDNRQLHFALCSLLYALAVRCPLNTNFLISAKETSLLILGCPMLEIDWLNDLSSIQTASPQNDLEHGLFLSLRYLHAINAQISPVEDMERQGLVIELPPGQAE